MIKTALLTFALFATATSFAAEKALPQVLIIGDSISIGYTPQVKNTLRDKAEVKHNQGNAQFTATGIKRIDAWLGETQWDVIHFNWGLWDLCYRHPDAKEQGNRDKVNGTLTTSPEQYEKNLDQLVQRLKKTEAALIWAHTTKVPEDEAGRKLNDDLKYNEIAAKVMHKHGITINDLNALSRTFDKSLFKKPGDVHFTAEGYKKLAEQVTQAIQQAL
jgi:lysophospholipase L1-like esterase